MRIDFDNAELYAAFLLNQPVIFTDSRIKMGTCPSWLYRYEVRHADDDDTFACEVQEAIGVNFMGTIFTFAPLDSGILLEHGDFEIFQDFDMKHFEIPESKKASK